jgi:hypothetical protein
MVISSTSHHLKSLEEPVVRDVAVSQADRMLGSYVFYPVVPNLYLVFEYYCRIVTCRVLTLSDQEER